MLPFVSDKNEKLLPSEKHLLAEMNHTTVQDSLVWGQEVGPAHEVNFSMST